MTDWPHAPVHRLGAGGTFMVTAGTYGKEHFFRGRDRLKLLHESLLTVAKEYEWALQSWVVFSNHYHFISSSPENDAESLRPLVKRLHSVTALAVNKLDATPGRRVWYDYWDTQLTYEKSYLARLRYVNENPVHHGLVQMANMYPFCSAAWFERVADRAFFQTVNSFKIDRLNVLDPFEPLGE